ncbi:MAG: hypothetical protein FE78DRAFT_72616 [Acidomyces sp. 'richmondensis']|nr:MAG: hypothetical protein FE78DRAFT_72616 [Acidomyces sp. 'richmondensis']
MADQKEWPPSIATTLRDAQEDRGNVPPTLHLATQSVGCPNGSACTWDLGVSKNSLTATSDIGGRCSNTVHRNRRAPPSDPSRHPHRDICATVFDGPGGFSLPDRDTGTHPLPHRYVGRPAWRGRARARARDAGRRTNDSTCTQTPTAENQPWMPRHRDQPEQASRAETGMGRNGPDWAFLLEQSISATLLCRETSMMPETEHPKHSPLARIRAARRAEEGNGTIWRRRWRGLEVKVQSGDREPMGGAQCLQRATPIGML